MMSLGALCALILPCEPSDCVVVCGVGEAEGVWVADTFDCQAVCSDDCPAEIPGVVGVSQGDGGLYADERVGCGDEEFLLGVVVAPAGLDEDLVLGEVGGVVGEVGEEVLDGDLDFAAVEECLGEGVYRAGCDCAISSVG